MKISNIKRKNGMKHQSITLQLTTPNILTCVQIPSYVSSIFNQNTTRKIHAQAPSQKFQELKGKVKMCSVRCTIQHPTFKHIIFRCICAYCSLRSEQSNVRKQNREKNLTTWTNLPKNYVCERIITCAFHPCAMCILHSTCVNMCCVRVQCRI